MPDQLDPSLADFLRAARSRLSPEDAGINQVGRRRVKGLRREELALLAGVSVDYYTRLEQGRSKSASLEVLDALADALRLDDSERSHLHAIARRDPSRRRRADKPQRLHESTRALLATLNTAMHPAFVLGRRLDVLGHNALAGLLVTDFEQLPATERNQARFVFLDPHARDLYRDWDAVAADSAAMLRMDAGRHPDDPRLGALIGELSIHSPEFGRLWARNRVHERTTGTKDYHHPLVGDLTVTYQALTPGDDPQQSIFVYRTETGSASEHALHLLARLADDHTATSTAGENPRSTAQATPDHRTGTGRS